MNVRCGVWTTRGVGCSAQAPARPAAIQRARPSFPAQLHTPPDSSESHLVWRKLRQPPSDLRSLLGRGLELGHLKLGHLKRWLGPLRLGLLRDVLGLGGHLGRGRLGRLRGLRRLARHLDVHLGRLLDDELADRARLEADLILLPELQTERERGREEEAN